MTNVRLGSAMEHLTDGLPTETIAAIKLAESRLCLVFRYQTSWGTQRCFDLRQTLVDLVRQAEDNRYDHNPGKTGGAIALYDRFQ